MSAAMGEGALTLRLSDPALAAEQIAERARETRSPRSWASMTRARWPPRWAPSASGCPATRREPSPARAIRRRCAGRSRRPASRSRGLPCCPVELTSRPSRARFPCVVKPLGLSGSRGVIRADDAEQARAAAERVWGILAAAQQPSGTPLLLESYLPGVEVAIEGLLRGGRLEVLAVFDKPDPPRGPYFEETLYVTPSRLPTAVQAEVEAVTARAARALGLREGPIHAELRVDGERVSVLELAARSSGGLCSRALRFGGGVSLEQVILR